MKAATINERIAKVRGMEIEPVTDDLMDRLVTHLSRMECAEYIMWIDRELRRTQIPKITATQKAEAWLKVKEAHDDADQ